MIPQQVGSLTECSTLIDLLRLQAEQQPNALAYRFLLTGEVDGPTEEITYGELDLRARAIAACLQEAAAGSERALLLYPPGLEFIAAFLGCAYAGVVAVPTYPHRKLSRLETIACDARARFVLTTAQFSKISQALRRQAPELAKARWIATDVPLREQASDLRQSHIAPETLVFLQYTSGSTGHPKGVMISHGNVLNNQRLIAQAFGTEPSTHVVGWLPVYHDMGLIGNVLHPLYMGISCTLFSPLAFLQRPMRWLEAISHFQGTVSGGPNFAFDHCVAKKEIDRPLDLSSWKVAFNGSEPVRKETMDRFAAAFADSGFGTAAFFPCYGLAEATLFVTSGDLNLPPACATLDAAALERNLAVEVPFNTPGARNLVSSGQCQPNHRLTIVHPETHQSCPDGGIGEIWIAGPSIARGYWDKPQETLETFKAHIGDDKTRYFLRTGDLGFLLNGQLFVAGRLKDLIIIRGRNLYPQDIEFTVQMAHAAVRPGNCAAFSVETEGGEKLVIVAEVNSQTGKTELPLVVDAARRAVAEEHATHVRHVVLLRSNSIPKTSSGKIRRDACRKALASGELAVIFTSTIEDSAAPDPRQAELAALESTSLAQEMRSADSQTRIRLIERFVQRLCARYLRVDIDRVDLAASPASLGLDSLILMELQTEFETHLNLSLTEAVFLQQPTLHAAASELLAAWETQQDGTIAVDLLPDSLDGNLPLSSGQQRLWFLDRLLPGNPVYNVHFGLRMTGLLSRDLLRRSLTELISRHVILRTVFREVNGRPWQSVRPLIPTELELIDLSSTPGPEQEGRLRQLAEELAMQPFDVTTGPLIRFHLVAFAHDRHALLIAQHHIITDGWSIMLFARELAAIFRALLLETPLGMPPELQFADYARWEQLNVARWEDDRAFWLEQLSDLPSHGLPADYPRPPRRSFRGSHLSFRLPQESIARIVSLGRSEGCTPFITLLTGYCVLLARYMAQDEFAVGSFIANRGRAQLREMIGFFTNTVVLRCDLSGTPSFRELSRRTRLVVADALRHGKLPFAEVVQMVIGVRDGDENPLFQAAFVLESPIPEIQIPKMTWQGISWTPDGAVNGTSKFDIMLALQETPETFVGALEYSSDLFEVSTVERFAAHLSTLYDNIAMQPDCPVIELSIFSLVERQQLLVEWNRTEAEVPRDVCLPELFQRQAAKTPDAVAVFTQRGQVTYRELNQRANRLARHLRSRGVGLETVVALLLGRGTEFLTCMLAVFKAGGAYLPLDPHHPLLRQLQLLQQSGVRHVISTREWARELVSAVPPGVQVFDIEVASGLEEADSDLPALCRPSHLVYVIYTSGSTGTPKGAMVEHLGMLNHLYAKVRDLQLNESDVVAQTASQSFDISVWQFLAVLLVGGRVRIVSEEVAVDPVQLMMEIEAAKISIAEMVPSMLRAGLEEMESGATTGPDLSSLRRLLLTGEALPPELARRWLNHYPEIPLLNAYGPTECSDDVAHHCISSGADLGRVYIPIGRPIVNTRLYVLDGELEPVPVGVPGELFVGGICVGRGYQNDAARTAETFIPDLYATEEGARLYRSGDVVRWLPGGEIVFLGRRDHQVKIRGFRIELGEIEALLESQAGVKQAVVLAQADQRANQRLVAYVAVREEITPEQLEQELKQRLPEYMVPAVYVLLPSMPLTPNGKIDRQALPAVELGEGGEDRYVAPRTPVEEIVCGIWQEVLGVERVGVKENFFHSGGHSLLATQVMARVRSSFGIELPLRTMFERPTVAELAAEVETARAAGRQRTMPALVRVEQGRELRLSFAQQRLWFLDQLEPGGTTYNIPGAVRMLGPLHVEALESSLRQIVERHASLRTRFVALEGEPRQVIADEVEVKLKVEDVSGWEGEEREKEVERRARAEAQQGFDLSRGPLLRARLLRCGEQEHVLLLTLHHIISDGWSLGVLVREASELYEAQLEGRTAELPELPIQYVDYSEWQREWLQGEVLEEQMRYWRGQLEGLRTMEFPTDRPRRAVHGNQGAQQPLVLEKELVQDLRREGQRQGATLFMLLLGGLQALLYRYNGQGDVSVGTAIAGRTRRELEGLIGFFVNTLVMRVEMEGSWQVKELVQRVKEVTLEGYEHQDVPFEKLVEELAPERDLGRTPLFQVMFILQNAPMPELRFGSAQAQPFLVDSGTAKFDLMLSVEEMEDEICGWVEYNTDLFDAATMQRMMEHYCRILAGMVATPDQRIEWLPLLSEPERRQLLTEWNNTAMDYSLERCVHELFEEQVARTPDGIAILGSERPVSFGELNQRANRLAHYLRRQGIGPEVRVGLRLERSVEMLVGLLGVLKAGGAYVPLDPAYPQERLKYMIEDAEAPLLLTQNRLLAVLPQTQCRVICLDSSESEAAMAEEPVVNLQSGVGPQNLAYVIYTSGSTGRSKGVAMPQRPLANLIQWQMRRCSMQSTPRTLQFTSLSFDVSFQEIFSTWCGGGTLVLIQEETRRDPLLLWRVLQQAEVERLFLPYAALQQLAEARTAVEDVGQLRLKEVIAAGEQLRITPAVKALFEGLGPCVLENQYGPTESHIVSAHRLQGTTEQWPGLPPIGVPMGNTVMFVLDENLELAPVGVVGQLYLGGEVLARGYLNQPGLTAGRFLPDAYSGMKGGRLYWTGDRGRYRGDGTVEYLGRIDEQVKIRGYRVEPGEVEAVLGQHPNVRETAVVAHRDGTGGLRLVGYVVLHPGVNVEVAELRNFLQDKLPDYMVPSILMRLDEMPLTPSGKIARRALPALVLEAGRDSYVAPRTPLEEILCGMWREILGVERVGVTENFFDLGGHSLLATQVMARLHSKFGVQVPLRMLFEQPTIESLASRVQDLQALKADDSPPIQLQRVARSAISLPADLD